VWRTPGDVLGDGSQQVEDVDVLPDVDEDLQLRQQRHDLVPVCTVWKMGMVG